MLVDAETLLAKDAIIRDQIRTFVRGYVKEYAPISDWQEDGLDYVRIRAAVEMDRLRERLEPHKVVSRDVSGELFRRQLVHDLRAEAEASQMLAGELADVTLDRLLTVAHVTQPSVVEQDSTKAKFAVKVGLASDMEAWKTIRDGLLPLLAKLSGRETVLSAAPAYNKAEDFFPFGLTASESGKLKRRLALPGHSILVLNCTNATGSRTFWNVFSTADAIAGAPLRAAQQRQYRLVLEVTDEEGRRIATAAQPLPGNVSQISTGNALAGYYGYVLSPFLWQQTSLYLASYANTRSIEMTFTLNIADIPDRLKCHASIEEVRREQEEK